MDCWTVLFFKMVGCEWFVWVWYWYNEYWMDRSNVLYEYGLTEKEDYWLLLVGSSFECRRDWIAINNWRLLRDDDGIDWQLKDYVCCSVTFISSLNIAEQSICFWFLWWFGNLWFFLIIEILSLLCLAVPPQLYKYLWIYRKKLFQLVKVQYIESSR